MNNKSYISTSQPQQVAYKINLTLVTLSILLFFLSLNVLQAQYCIYKSTWERTSEYNFSLEEWSSWSTIAVVDAHYVTFNQDYFTLTEGRASFRLTDIKFLNYAESWTHYHGSIYLDGYEVGNFELAIKNYKYTDMTRCTLQSAEIIIWLIIPVSKSGAAIYLPLYKT